MAQHDLANVRPPRSRAVSAALFGLFAALAAAPAVGAAEPVAVSITDSGCQPAAFTLPAGETTFAIDNVSEELITWAIVKGDAEVKNETVPPGEKASVAVAMEPGTYQMICGAPTLTQGTLTVGGEG